MNATTSSPGPESPADTVNRIRGEFADITRRLSHASDELTALHGVLLTQTAAPAQPVHTPPIPPQPTPTQAPQLHPLQPPTATFPPPLFTPNYRVPQYAPAPPRVQPLPPPPRPLPVPPRASTAEKMTAASEGGLIGKILAGIGVAITLIGVVLLLVLAAQAGLLRPELRVAGGALLAATLFGIGVRLGHNVQKRSGAVALVATGVAAALFDVLAATAIYHWLPDYAALLVAAVLAGGGLVVAHVWDSQSLGLMVGIPLVVLAPFLAGGDDEILVAFLLTYVAVTLWIQLGRNWTAMFITNTAVGTLPVLYGLVAWSSDDRWFFLIAASLNVVLAIVSVLVLMRSSTRPVILALTSSATVCPMFGAVHITGGPLASTLLGVTAAILLALAVAGRPLGVPVPVRVVWLATSSVTALVACASILEGAGLAVAVAGIAVVTACAAAVGKVSGTGGDLNLTVAVIATIATGISLAGTLLSGAVAQLLFADALPTGDQALMLITEVLTLAAIVVLAWSWAQGAGGEQLQAIWTVGTVAALWQVTLLCVGLGALIGGGSDAGIRGGHAAATIVWVLTGAAGLLWARRQRGSARTVTLSVSLSIIGAAVAKLFLFDLATLDGVFRVIAFIVVGLLLLSLGVAYAQSLNSDDDRSVTPR